MRPPPWSLVSKAAGIAVLYCGSVWYAFGPEPDRARAAELFGLASAAAGFTSTAGKVRRDLAVIRRDTGATRDDPAAPGKPPSAAEFADHDPS